MQQSIFSTRSTYLNRITLFIMTWAAVITFVGLAIIGGILLVAINKRKSRKQFWVNNLAKPNDDEFYNFDITGKSISEHLLDEEILN